MTRDKPLLLFIEDEQNLAEIVKESLETRQFTVEHYSCVSDGIGFFLKQKPDLVILDVMLPDGDGFELARHIRQSDKEIPIIFLTSKLLPQDVVEGFESGGNDYLKKPFSLEELVVRIKVLLNKNRHLYTDKIAGDKIISIGRYLFDHLTARLTADGYTVQLTARESELLKMLVLNKNSVVDRKTLLLKIWGAHDYFTGRSLDVFITKLRKHLSRDKRIIIMNVRGIGYKLIES